MHQLTVLGSTGSIGRSTLDVVRRHRDEFEIVALAANCDVTRMLADCLEFSPRYAVLVQDEAAVALRLALAEANSPTEVLSGSAALCEVARLTAVDTVMAAIVGAAGLLPAMAAIEAGKRVLLANKEALVMSGALFMQAAVTHGAFAGEPTVLGSGPLLPAETATKMPASNAASMASASVLCHGSREPPPIE